MNLLTTSTPNYTSKLALNMATALSSTPSDTRENHWMIHIRKVLRKYRNQSPAHFELGIEVQLVPSTHMTDGQTNPRHTSPAFKVLMQGNTIEGRIAVLASCFVTPRRRRSNSSPREWIVFADDGRRTEIFERFLKTTFRVIEGSLQQDTMWQWWSSNDKTFNWSVLPTELKERIMEFCIHQPPSVGIYSERLTRFDQCYKNHRDIRNPGPLEIVAQLGDWYQIIYVSHQMRAITLRLCLRGGSSLTCSKGLCVTTSSLTSLSEKLDRLGDYYQMIEPNSVPTTAREQALSKCYGRFPKIYPEFHQYATFRHGIQKVSLGMDFLSFMHFFKVGIGSFQGIFKARTPTCHVFERLPNLNEIVLRLPLRPRGGWKNNPYAGGPPLFHHQSPCPRILHRMIYERVAQVLAAYENVKVRNFIDAGEEQRFLSRRADAIRSLKFTKFELQELYAETGGGVELPEGVEREVKNVVKVQQEDMDIDQQGPFVIGFLPPGCHCDEPCVMSSIFIKSDRHY